MDTQASSAAHNPVSDEDDSEDMLEFERTEPQVHPHQTAPPHISSPSSASRGIKFESKLAESPDVHDDVDIILEPVAEEPPPLRCAHEWECCGHSHQVPT